MSIVIRLYLRLTVPETVCVRRCDKKVGRVIITTVTAARPNMNALARRYRQRYVLAIDTRSTMHVHIGTVARKMVETIARTYKF